MCGDHVSHCAKRKCEHYPLTILARLGALNYHLFGILKTSLDGRFTTNNEAEKWTCAFFAHLDRSVYDAEMCKLVPRYEKCLEWCRNLMNKYKFLHIFCVFFRWFLEIGKLTFGTPLVYCTVCYFLNIVGPLWELCKSKIVHFSGDEKTFFKFCSQLRTHDFKKSNLKP